MHAPIQKQRGFTLVELLITVTILGILATAAVYTYQHQMYKVRRGDALTALSQVAQALERHYTDNNTYTTDISALPSPASDVSAEGWYHISIPSADGSSYTVRATAAGLQSGDTDCGTIELTSTGGKTPAACW